MNIFDRLKRFLGNFFTVLCACETIYYVGRKTNISRFQFLETFARNTIITSAIQGNALLVGGRGEAPCLQQRVALGGYLGRKSSSE
jgi:hypothetical protein